MRKRLSIILDECIERISDGESIEDCLIRYPEIRDRLQPLLSIVRSVTNMPDVKPSRQFKQVSRDRLVSRIESYEELISIRSIKGGDDL